MRTMFHVKHLAAKWDSFSFGEPGSIMVSNDYPPTPPSFQMMIGVFGAGAPVVGQRLFIPMVQIMFYTIWCGTPSLLSQSARGRQ